MEATELIKNQHQAVFEIFDRMEATAAPAEKKRLFQELTSQLLAHDWIEREIFYPACHGALGWTQELGKAAAEHEVVRFSVLMTHEAYGRAGFEARLAVLEEMFRQHVEDEERSLLPEAERAMGEARLEALGAHMEERFEELMSADLLGSVRGELTRVVGPAAAPPRKRATKRPARKPSARAAQRPKKPAKPAGRGRGARPAKVARGGAKARRKAPAGAAKR